MVAKKRTFTLSSPSMPDDFEFDLRNAVEIKPDSKNGTIAYQRDGLVVDGQIVTLQLTIWGKEPVLKRLGYWK